MRKKKNENGEGGRERGGKKIKPRIVWHFLHGICRVKVVTLSNTNHTIFHACTFPLNYASDYKSSSTETTPCLKYVGSDTTG